MDSKDQHSYLCNHGWHKHEAADILCAQTPALLKGVAWTLAERHRCVDANTIEYPVLKIYSFR